MSATASSLIAVSISDILVSIGVTSAEAFSNAWLYSVSNKSLTA